MTNINQLWHEYSSNISEEPIWTVGNLELRARFEKNEIWLANSDCTNGKSNHSLSRGIAEPAWSRWSIISSPSTISIEPEFPDKSIVVKPEKPFRLLPSVEAKIFIRVPIWVKVTIPQKKGQSRTLSEFPSITMSLTWFGTTMEGELCYWLVSSIRNTISPELFEPHLAICPVKIKNNSSEELLVDKLCLRVKWLSLYLFDNQLWADVTSISYRGTGEISHVDTAAKAPLETPGAKLICPPREINKRGHSIRTFFNL